MENHTCLICLNFIGNQTRRPLSVYQKVFSTCKKHLHCSITDETLTDDWEPAKKQKQLPLCDDCVNGSLELAKIADNLEKFQKQVNDLLLVFSLKILHRRSQVATLEPLSEERNSLEIDISKLSQHFNLPKPTSAEHNDTEQEIKISNSSSQQDKLFPMIDVSTVKSEFIYEDVGEQGGETLTEETSDSENFFVYYPHGETPDLDISVTDTTQLVQRNLNEEFFIAADIIESPAKSDRSSRSSDLKVNLERLKFKNDGTPIVNENETRERSKRKAFLSASAQIHDGNADDDDDDDDSIDDDILGEKDFDVVDIDEDYEEEPELLTNVKQTKHTVNVSLLNLQRTKVALPKITSSNYNDRSTRGATIIHKKVKSNNSNKRRRKADPLATNKKKTSGKVYQCEVCEYTTAHQNYLVVHMRSHTGERPYKCHKCGKTFRQTAHLRVHLLTHSKIKHYKCPVCKKGYSNSSSLRGHINRHTGVKKFICSMCDYATSESGNLKRHITTHTDLKPFKCADCGQMYKSKMAIRNHYKSSHPDVEFTLDCIIDG